MSFATQPRRRSGSGDAGSPMWWPSTSGPSSIRNSRRRPQLATRRARTWKRCVPAGHSRPRSDSVACARAAATGHATGNPSQRKRGQGGSGRGGHEARARTPRADARDNGGTVVGALRDR
eukprot:4158400-Pleurochrysis_carterae.AAC.2